MIQLDSTQEDYGLRKKLYGKWVEIEVQLDDDQPKSPQHRLWSEVLCEMVYDYIGGETEDDFSSRYDPIDHLEAERWIFGDQSNDLSFDQIWRIIFENIDPKLVKDRLRLIFKRRLEKFMKRVEFNNKRFIKKRIKNEAENSPGRKRTTPCDPDPTRRDSGRNQWKSWLDNVLRGPDDS